MDFAFQLHPQAQHLLKRTKWAAFYCQRVDIAYSPTLNREGNYFGYGPYQILPSPIKA